MTYPTQIYINEIKIDPDRQRKDLGDLTNEIESIEEVGLIEPIVLNWRDDSFWLVAGERRLTCCRSLGYETLTHGNTSIPGAPGYIAIEEVDKDTLFQIEFDENVRRKNLTWQEQCIAISRRHKQLVIKAAVEKGAKWLARETGDMLGYSRQHVDFCNIVAERLIAKDEEITSCSSVFDAYKTLLGRAENESEKRKLELAREAMPHIVQASEKQELFEEGSPIVKPSLNINPRCYHQSFEDWAASQPDGCVNHIITDPPYAIDMANLEQQNIGQNVGLTKLTHDVDKNLNDMPTWMRECYRLTDDRGFCVWWLDQDNWQYVKDLALMSGFAVQRWPIYWKKTSSCQNGAAQYNFTKKTEIAMVMRKKGATLADSKASSDDTFTGSGDADRVRFGHPFTKPLELHKFLLRAIALKGQTILDPFAGRGSFAVAGIDYGITPISIEIDKEHYPHLLDNVKQAYVKALPNHTVNFTQ